ncbi:hypothetical protein HYU23_01545 [Candidatus Woesearchaeota archaeon]|nr:hypothetical protein [Candidatus Woesearchaeota archaeon]
MAENNLETKLKLVLIKEISRSLKILRESQIRLLVKEKRKNYTDGNGYWSEKNIFTYIGKEQVLVTKEVTSPSFYYRGTYANYDTRREIRGVIDIKDFYKELNLNELNLVHKKLHRD